MQKPYSQVLGNNLRAFNLGSGLFLVTTDRHGGLAVNKESVGQLEYLKPLLKLDLTRFEVIDDQNFYYFESHINQAIIHSLLPAQVYMQINSSKNLAIAATECEKAKNTVIDHFPMLYEQMHGIQLEKSVSLGIAEAEFYQSNQNHYLISSLKSDVEFGSKNEPDITYVKFNARKISAGEIYGNFIPEQDAFKLTMETYEKLVKQKLHKMEYPSNKQLQIMLHEQDIAVLEQYRKAS